MLRQLSTVKPSANPTKSIDRSAIGEDVLRLLEAALDSVPGFLPDVADHAGLTVPEAIKLGDLLVRQGLLFAFDDEPWAPTVEGYKLIQHRRQPTSEERSTQSAQNSRSVQASHVNVSARRAR